MKLVAAALLLALAACEPPVTGETSGAIAAPLTVVLTFDDTFLDQYVVAAPMLEARGMRGTFLVNAPRLTWGGQYMSTAQVLDLQARGHEIGGHTLDHVNLVQTPEPERLRQICENHARLVALGIDDTSFAYPSGADDATVWPDVLSCYARGRDIGGAANPLGFCGGAPSCTGCAYAETATPRNVASIRTAPSSVGVGCDAADPALSVSLAEQHPVAGQVLVINFHHLCDGCDPTLAFSPARFAALLDWLVATGVPTRTLAQAFP